MTRSAADRLSPSPYQGSASMRFFLRAARKWMSYSFDFTIDSKVIFSFSHVSSSNRTTQLSALEESTQERFQAARRLFRTEGNCEFAIPYKGTR